MIKIFPIFTNHTSQITKFYFNSYFALAFISYRFFSSLIASQNIIDYSSFLLLLFLFILLTKFSYDESPKNIAEFDKLLIQALNLVCPISVNSVVPGPVRYYGVRQL